MTLILGDSNKILKDFANEKRLFDLIYADPVYEDRRFESWVDSCFTLLKDTGVFLIQSDYHSIHEYYAYIKLFWELLPVNELIYVNEWGGTPKKGFPNKHDTILVYAKSDSWKWDSSKILIPKKTAGTSFDKKGTGTKVPCSVFYDHLSFSTMSNERVKTEDGRNVRWQKPRHLLDRLLLPYTDEGDDVLDVFAGVASLGESCKAHKRNYTGIEIDPVVFGLAEKRLNAQV